MTSTAPHMHVSGSRGPGRHTVRPSGAFKLLTVLLYGSFPYVNVKDQRIIEIIHISKLARVLGTESKKVRKWLDYLENASYIESLAFSENRRQASFRLRRPPNV